MFKLSRILHHAGSPIPGATTPVDSRSGETHLYLLQVSGTSSALWTCGLRYAALEFSCRGLYTFISASFNCPLGLSIPLDSEKHGGRPPPGTGSQYAEPKGRTDPVASSCRVTFFPEAE
jgi:hypothetical protein